MWPFTCKLHRLLRVQAPSPREGDRWRVSRWRATGEGDRQMGQATRDVVRRMLPLIFSPELDEKFSIKFLLEFLFLPSFLSKETKKIDIYFFSSLFSL